MHLLPGWYRFTCTAVYMWLTTCTHVAEGLSDNATYHYRIEECVHNPSSIATLPCRSLEYQALQLIMLSLMRPAACMLSLHKVERWALTLEGVDTEIVGTLVPIYVYISLQDVSTWRRAKFCNQTQPHLMSCKEDLPQKLPAQVLLSAKGMLAGHPSCEESCHLEMPCHMRTWEATAAAGWKVTGSTLNLQVRVGGGPFHAVRREPRWHM